LSPSRT